MLFLTINQHLSVVKTFNLVNIKYEIEVPVGSENEGVLKVVYSAVILKYVNIQWCCFNNYYNVLWSYRALAMPVENFQYIKIIHVYLTYK